MKKIEVDDEVYQALVDAAVPFADKSENDVLRRVLLNGRENRKSTAPEKSKRPGELFSLIQAGLVKDGDRVYFRQPRKRLTHEGRVNKNGWISVCPQGGRPLAFAQPSPALKALVKTEINGWERWVHDASGKTLRQLRDESGA